LIKHACYEADLRENYFSVNFSSFYVFLCEASRRSPLASERVCDASRRAPYKVTNRVSALATASLFHFLLIFLVLFVSFFFRGFSQYLGSFVILSFVSFLGILVFSFQLF
jgi:hypothetical protein